MGSTQHNLNLYILWRYTWAMTGRDAQPPTECSKESFIPNRNHELESSALSNRSFKMYTFRRFWAKWSGIQQNLETREINAIKALQAEKITP